MKKYMFCICVVFFSIFSATSISITRIQPPVLHSYASVIERTLPSVVVINVIKVSQYVTNKGRISKKSNFYGSGIVVRNNGYIVTSYHLMEHASRISVMLHNGKKYHAKLIAFDADTDIAIIKITADHLDVIPFADSDKIKVGDVVLAIGNPFSIGKSVSQGIISAVNKRRIGLQQYEQFILTDSAINQGSSGGALVNSVGLLVGMNQGIYSRDEGFQGVAIVVPSNQLKYEIDQLIKSGRISRGSLGLKLQTITKSLRKNMPLLPSHGVMVLGFKKHANDALKRKLKKNDVITAVNGVSVSSTRGLLALLALRRVGTLVDLNVDREGRKLTLPAFVSRQVKDGVVGDIHSGSKWGKLPDHRHID